MVARNCSRNGKWNKSGNFIEKKAIGQHRQKTKPEKEEKEAKEKEEG
jgi:hypothetical protein